MLLYWHWWIRSSLIVQITWIVFYGRTEAVEMFGPRFVREPPSDIDFSNSTGISIDCVAKGVPSPVVEWIRPDGAAVGNVQGLRTVLSNGTIHFPPFRAEEYRQDVHASIYACSANNPFGRIISRDIKIRAVVQQYYEAQVYDEFVIRGSTAVFRCQIPSFVLDYVVVTSWTRETSNGVQIVIESGGRFTVFPSGILHIRDVTSGDGGKHYRCRTQHRLTGEVRLSSTAGRLLITEPQSSVPPRITHSMGMVEAYQGDAVELPCAAQGSPTPIYVWMKVKDGLFYPVTLGERILQLGGNLLLRNVQMVDSGTYVCIVNNSVGTERIETTLFVTATLSVRVQPNSQVVDVEKTATMTCVVTGYPVTSVTWYKDGKPLTMGGRFKTVAKDSLRIEVIHREDKGMYQCVARNRQMTAQGTAELKLGDAVPLLQEKFSAQLVSPGRSVSLKCIISGNPPPHVSWTLDDEPLPKKSNFFIADYVNIHGDVISQVNISEVKTEDGGEYKCTGKNTVGKTEHVARLNVTGPPFIRHMANISVVAGRTAHLKCRVSGHPIESILWKRDGTILPVNHRQKVYTNGSLFILNVQQTMDAGSYVCFAQSPSGQTAQRRIHVYILNAPMISPFAFADNLRVGMRAGVTCLITQGDPPIKIEWFKDKQPIGTNLGISVRNIDEYTSNLVITSIATRHNGNYTCSASNAAATVEFTATLLVKVPPQWLIEPKDTHVTLHRSTKIDCQAEGFPQPTIKWKKATGNVPVDYREIPSEGLGRYMAENNSLIIHRADETDEGHFLCQAHNGIGAELSKVIYLDVRIPAYFEVKRRNETVIKGEKGKLICEARGDLPITIIWKVDGTLLTSMSNPRVKIDEKAAVNGWQSELVISKTTSKDFAPFSCHASNPFGSDDQQIQLIVLDLPDVPVHVTPTQITSRSLHLSWEAAFDGNSPILRYVVQYKVGEDSWSKSEINTSVVSDKTSTQVTGLLPAKRYDFRVRAENIVGLSNASSVIQITTDEEEPEGPPLDVELEPVTSQSLRVTWKPPRRELWHGQLTGYKIGYKQVDSEDQYILKTTDHRPGNNIYLISNLKKFHRYSVVIAAFNSKGSGPQSEQVMAATLEDVPSQPPSDVACSTITTNTIIVTWKSPPLQSIHGLLQGYKVYYELSDGLQERSSATTKSLQMEVTNLRSFSNYTISVIAYTRAGDGVASDRVYCQTFENVPSPPSKIKALIMSSDAILISWLPPHNPNGIITKYTIFMRQTGHNQPEVISHSLPANQHYFEARGLKENVHYEFWVTAATSVGDGGKTRTVSQSPTSIVPAKIASFPEKHAVPQKTDVRLPCRSVGIPTPDREWRLRGKKVSSESRFQLASDGALSIAAVRNSDSGNYTCRIYNIYATDELTHEVVVHPDKERKGPPTPPVVSVVALNVSSLLILWSVEDDGSSAIKSYTLNYKLAGEAWDTVHLESNATNHTLKGLQCGSRYQVYMSAHNRFGPSRPSEVVLANTRGKAPEVPSKDALISTNSSSVVLNLEAWLSDDPETCKVNYLSIDYRAYNQREWTLVMQSVRIVKQSSFTINDLVVGTSYILRITAHSDTGLTIADYDVSLIEEHGALPDSSLQNHSKTYHFYLDMNVIVSTVIIVAVVAVVFAAGCYIIHRKRYTGYKHGEYPKHQKQTEPEEKTHFSKPTTEQLSQNYSPTRRKDQTNPEASLFHPSLQDDICPYATYQLPGCLSEDGVELRTFAPQTLGTDMLQPISALPVNVVYSKVKKQPKQVTLEIDQTQNKSNEYDIQRTYYEEKTCPMTCDVLPKKIYSESVIPTAPPADYDESGRKRLEDNKSNAHSHIEPNLRNRQFHKVPDLLYHQHESSTSNESSPPDSDSRCSSRSNSHCSTPETANEHRDRFKYSYPSTKIKEVGRIRDKNNAEYETNQDNEVKRMQAVKLAAAEEELIALLKR